MNAPRDKLSAALRAVEAGDFDALTAEQIEQLEQLLNENPALAEQLGAAVPQPEEPLAEALAASERLPSPSEWERVGLRIDAAGERTRRVRHPVILRLWQPLAAAAACLVLVVLWNWKPAAAPAADWPMQLASNVEIDSIEVGDNATPFVVSVGNDGDSQVIWVLEDQG